jgi:hypothetical protein
MVGPDALLVALGEHPVRTRPPALDPLSRRHSLTGSGDKSQVTVSTRSRISPVWKIGHRFVYEMGHDGRQGDSSLFAAVGARGRSERPRLVSEALDPVLVNCSHPGRLILAEGWATCSQSGRNSSVSPFHSLSLGSTSVQPSSSSSRSPLRRLQFQQARTRFPVPSDRLHWRWAGYDRALLIVK